MRFEALSGEAARGMGRKNGSAANFPGSAAQSLKTYTKTPATRRLIVYTCESFDKHCSRDHNYKFNTLNQT